MSEVKITKYNNKFYIRSSNPYYINISGTNKILTNNNGTIKIEIYNKTNKNQQIYIWQCMDGTHDFILQPVDNEKVFNVSGGFDNKNSTTPTNESGPKLILYNKISKYSSTCYSSPTSNLQENNLFWNNDNNGGYIIPTVTTIKSVNSREYLQILNDNLFMGLSPTNIKYIDNNENFVNYPGNNKDRKNITKIGNYFTLNTGGEYQMYRSKKFYYIKSGSFVFDVCSGGKNNGTKIQLYTYNATGAQQWYLWKDNFNRYGFQNVNSNKWLDLPDGNKIQSGQKNPIQMQIYTDLEGKTIHRNQMFSLNKKEDTKYYIQNTYCDVLDWVIAGLANNQGSAVAFQEKGKYNYVQFSTNGTDTIDLNNIEFEIPTYEKFNITPYYIHTEEELKGQNYEFGELTTPQYHKDLTFKAKYNSNSISNQDVINSFFDNIDKACTEVGQNLNIQFNNNEILTKLDIKPKTETNLLNLQNLEFRFQYDGISKTFLYNWSKLFGLRTSKTNSASILNLFSFLSNIEDNNPDFLIKFTDYNSDFINKITSKDTKLIELLGWNRYRPDNTSEINYHLSYLNYSFTLFVNNVLNKRLNNENIDLIKSFKSMFIDTKTKKVYDYVLYTGLFAQLLKLYEHEFLDYIPQQNIQTLKYLPYWNTNNDYFTGTENNVTTAWSILSPNKHSNNIPNGIEKNILSIPEDYNNIFQLYNGDKNLSHKLINISPKNNKNEDDFKNSYDKLINTVDKVIYKVVDNNFKPGHKNFNDAKLNYVISKEPKFEDFVIGSRYKGCKVGKGRKWYGIKIGVIKVDYLKNSGKKRVNCGNAAGLNSSESDGPHISLQSTSLLPIEVKVEVYAQDKFGGNLGLDSIATFKLNDYKLEYVNDYGGIDESCNKNSKCVSNEPTGDAFGCNKLKCSDYKEATYKCNFTTLTSENFITINNVRYNIDVSFQNKLNDLTKNATLKSELLSDELIKGPVHSKEHTLYKDTWWIREKNNSGNRYIKGMFDKKNQTLTKDDNFGNYYGNLLEFKDAFYIGDDERYMGNPSLENKTCPNVDSDVSSNTDFTKSPSNDLARCFVKTNNDNIIMRIFDSRVEQFIYEIIEKHSTIFANDLEIEILEYFKNNPLNLIPYRTIKNYIPYNTIPNINQPIRSNLENLLGPILINVTNPILVQYHNYISNFVENYQFITLNSNNYKTKNIGTLNINNNYTHYLDKMMYELNHLFSNLGDFKNKAIVLTLFVNYYNIYNYISTDLNQNLYNIQICDTSSENNREDNKEHIAYNLKHLNSDCVKLIITNSELKDLDKIDLKTIATHDLPFVNCYNKKYNIENLEQQTDDENLDSFFSYTFKYGIHKMYLYTQQSFNSITSYANSDKLSQDGSLNKNEGLEAYNIRVTIDPSLNSSASWLQPNWNTEENILDIQL